MRPPPIIEFHAAPHPDSQVRQAGFGIDHPYVERCWTPVVGPTSVLMLRRVAELWRDEMPARVPIHELAAHLGLGRGTGSDSPVARTLGRLAHFRFVTVHDDQPGAVFVYTRAPVVPAHHLGRMPAWCRRQHEEMTGHQVSPPSREAVQGSPVRPGHRAPSKPPEPNQAAQRAIARLDRLTTPTSDTATGLHR